MAYQRGSQRYHADGPSSSDGMLPAPPPRPPPPPPPLQHQHQHQQSHSESQYGIQYSTPSTHPSQGPPQRRPSYQAGDDSRYFERATAQRMDSYPSHTRGDGGSVHTLNSGGSQHSQFSADSSQYSTLSHASSHGSSGLSGYQHRYNVPTAPTPTQTSYNPQHFAQASSPVQPPQSQSGYNPQAFTSAPASQPSNQFQPQSYPQYNPAAYQSSPASSYHSSPGSQSHGYGHSPQFQHHQIQSPTMSSQTNSFASPPYDANLTGHQPVTSTSSALPPPPRPPPVPRRPLPQHTGQNSWGGVSVQTALMPDHTQYTQMVSNYGYSSGPPQAPVPHGQSSDTSNPRLENGSPYRNVPSTAAFSSQPPPPTDAPPAPPVHQHTHVSPRRTDTLTRHPQSRPLPGPPVEAYDDSFAVGTTNNDRNHTSTSYEDIMREVEAAVTEGRGTGTGRHSSTHGHSHILTAPDEEAEHTQIAPDETQTHTNAHGNFSSTGTGQYINYDAYSDESDAEAAAGIAALQMADEEDQMFRTRRDTYTSASSPLGAHRGSLTSPTAAPHASHPADPNNDGDYTKYDDTGWPRRGSDMRTPYGEDDATTSNNDRAVTTSGSFRSSDRSTDGGAVGSDTHGYRGDDASARVDAVGTGGLCAPSLHPRRLSFDEDDETGLGESESRTSSVAEARGNSEPQDLFFHPGITGRPLPPPPVEEEPSDLRSHLMPAGTYAGHIQQQDQQLHQQHHHQKLQPPYRPNDPSSYASPEHADLAQSAPSAVPRSTSLTTHATIPRNDPLIRSKTDVDRVKSKQAGYDSTLPSPTVPVDLLPTIPAGRRKKFNPAKLSTDHFNKCTEPWALSSIVAWVKDLSEEETDLREQAIVNAIVALFTHKVPTMNTADAETLGAGVVKNMLDAGVLVQDEEWVKFGTQTLSGVLWQITGQGCYSSRLHDQDTDFFGRCYSHHCTRTLKKIDLQAHAMEPEKKAEDWATFYKIGKEVFDSHSKKEVDRQNNLHEIVTTEDSYIAQLDVLRTLYRDQLASYDPPVINPKRLDRFLRDVFGKVDAVKQVNEDFLLAQLKYRQKEQGPFIVGFSDIFREWIRKAKAAYIDYAATFPNANYLVRRELETNLVFRRFLDQARENKLSQRLSWDTFLKSPITRIQRYTLLLSGVHKNMIKDSEEKANLQQAIEEIKLVAMECDSKVGEMTKKVDLKELGSKIQLRPELKRVVELNLEHLGREIIHQGDLQRPRTKRFNWADTRVILFDHYLVLAKVVTSRDPSKGVKHESYDVSKLPIPMDLLVLVSRDDDAVMRSGVKGIVTANTRGDKPTMPAHTGTSSTIASTTVLENPKEDKILYPFKIKHLGKRDLYVLYAPTAQCREEWCDKIVEAKTKHAASLRAQNAEPFNLRVLSDAAFAYSDSAVPQKGMVIKGTPLDVAIRDVEKQYQSNVSRPLPVCRASVNCATVFRQPQGPMMCAIGTDFGVYLSEYDNPRGWRKTIGMQRVTQIAVFEEFNLFLLIADKSLIAYHLDAVCPANGTTTRNDSQRRAPQKLSGNREVGFFSAARMKDRALVFYKKRDGISSTFKVLEPIVHKSSSGRSRFIPRRGQTDFFREYDEFYIPADSYSINLFHTSLAISTSRGVEVLTLDKKQPWSVPNLRSDQPEAQTHLASISSRIKDLRPLGMFRLSEGEFLVVFEQCAVYVNKHGDISRSVVMEFVGQAHSACLCGKFLILFNEDFVEVRNAMNGRLRQVVSGKNVTLLDDGGNSGNVQAHSSTGTTSFHDGSTSAAGGQNGLGLSMGFGSVPRSVKISMQHPEYERSQVVLELVENEVQKD